MDKKTIKVTFNNKEFKSISTKLNNKEFFSAKIDEKQEDFHKTILNYNLNFNI